MKRRIFIAIGLDDSLKKLIETWQRKYKELPVRFIKPENLHLTLIPPWYDDADTIIQHLHQFASSVAPFSLQFQLITLGPDPKRPRLIWIEGNPSKELEKLKQELEQFLKIESEHRPFIPHVTIARAKEKGTMLLRQTNIHESIDVHFDVTSFCLMESHLSPKGAEYEILFTLPVAEVVQSPVRV